MNKLFFFFVLFLLACTGCGNKNKTSTAPTQFSLTYPYGFDSIVCPKDNALTGERIALGKKIFFDPRFSAGKKISCGSCHKPAFAFADTVALHQGAHGDLMFRNTPGLVNLAYHPYLDADGGVPTIEMQVYVPFDGTTEMHGNLMDAAADMKKDSDYVQLSRQAYGRLPDPFVITRALGAYQRSLISTGSRYDHYRQTGKGLDAEEMLGEKLFFSDRTQCCKCHSGVLFTDFSFQSLGMGNHTHDPGRARITRDDSDTGKFKTPGLRNVALTFPYMHDGSIRTLEEVIEFYDRGGGNSPNKSAWIKPLGLTAEEKKALVRFLHTLTDTVPYR